MAVADRIGAGALKQRLRFERRKQPGIDAFGNAETDWETVCILHASVTPQKLSASNAEQVMQGRLAARTLETIVVRWCNASSQITPDCRAVDVRNEKRIWNIRSVLDLDDSRQFLHLDAETGVPG